jgi:putative ABC transport system permease protein
VSRGWGKRVFRLPWRSRSAIVEEVDEEIAFHLEMRGAALERAGVPAAEARARARQEFGDLRTARREMARMDGASERERRLGDAVSAVGQDGRFALRTLARAPGFAAVAVLTLALGIGVNTTIFSVVSGVLLRPLPYAEAGRLVAVWEGFLRAEFELARERAHSFEELAGYEPGVEVNLTGEGDPVRVSGARVTAQLTGALGVAPLLGRGFMEGEDRAGGDAVVLLSHGLWRGRYGGDPGIVGRTIQVEGEPRTVVGVMPREFRFPDAGTQLWLPIPFDRSPQGMGSYWGIGGVRAVGRLRPGVNAEAAEAEMRLIAQELRLANPFWTPPADFREEARVLPLGATVTGEVRLLLLTLLGAAALVLLIACANLGNLLLARGLARTRELAVRAAIGAGRARLVRQLLTESMVLAAIGGIVGIALAFGALRLLLAALPADTPRLAEVGLDLRVLGLAGLTTLVCGLLFGAVPALRLTGSASRQALREGRGSGGPRRQRLSSTLVVGQLALGVVLVIGAGLLIRSFWELQRVEPGFATEQLLAARITPPAATHGARERQLELHRAVLERAAALPGVVRVAATSQLPFDRASGAAAFFIDGVTDDPNVLPELEHRSVTPGYTAALGIPLLRGRTLLASDNADAPPVALVDEAAARRFWPGEDPVGRCIRYPWRGAGCITVVGVVGSVRNNDLAAAPEGAVYVPLEQRPVGSITLVLRTQGDPLALARPLRAAVHEVEPTVPVSDVRTVGRMVAESMDRSRLTALLLGLFAGLALLLGAIGVYGVVSYSVQQRSREMGVRLALGAHRGDLFRLVLRQAGTLALLGGALGVAAALLATRALHSLLFQVTTMDPLVFLLVPLLLGGVAMLAAWVPARRATRVDPMEALRAE